MTLSICSERRAVFHKVHRTHNVFEVYFLRTRVKAKNTHYVIERNLGYSTTDTRNRPCKWCDARTGIKEHFAMNYLYFQWRFVILSGTSNLIQLTTRYSPYSHNATSSTLNMHVNCEVSKWDEYTQRKFNHHNSQMSRRLKCGKNFYPFTWRIIISQHFTFHWTN